MAYYYVSSVNGTRTGGSGLPATNNKRTGAWSSMTAGDTFATLADLVTAATSFAAGDVIVVEDDHDETFTASIELAGPVSGGAVFFISTDSTDCTAYSKMTTAIDASGSSIDFIIDNGWYIKGLVIDCGPNDGTIDDLSITPELDTPQVYEDCDLGWKGASGDTISIGSSVKFINCNIDIGSNGTLIVGAGMIEMRGGSITAGNGSYVFQDNLAYMSGVDLTGLTNSTPLVAGTTTANDVFLFGCKLPSGGLASITGNEINLIHAVACDDATGNDQWIYKKDFVTAGTIVQDRTVYISGKGLYDGTNECSLLITPNNSYAFLAKHIETDWHNVIVSSTGSKTLTVYLTSATQLYDNKVWLEVEYFGDSSSTQTTTLSTHEPNPLVTATELTTDSTTTWTNGATYKYKITTPSFTVNKAGLLRWRVASEEIGAGATLYLCPEADIT